MPRRSMAPKTPSLQRLLLWEAGNVSLHVNWFLFLLLLLKRRAFAAHPEYALPLADAYIQLKNS